MNTAWGVTAALLLLLGLSSGCSDGPPRLAADEQPPQAPSAPRELAGQQPDAKPRSANPRQPDDLRPVPESEQERRPGLIGSLRDFMESSPIFEESGVQEELFQGLSEAQDELTRIRRENAEALRQANRQIRIGRAANDPSVILIQIERLGFGDLGCYGGHATPNIDELAEAGLRFTNFYTASPDLKRARWCLMTGRNPASAPADPQSLRFTSGTRILSEMMWDAGYATAFSGVWDDVHLPTRRGYDEWVGFLNRDEVAEYPPSIALDETRMRIVANEDGQEQVHCIDLLVTESISFLQRHRQGRRPFFLHVTLPLLTDRTRPTPEDLARCDDAVGRLVSEVRHLGLGARTCIVLTAESGPILKDDRQSDEETGPFRIASHGLAEGNLRVPLIVYSPNRVLAGTSDRLCASWDLVPTLADLVSARRRLSGNGISFAPTFRNRPQSEHALLYWTQDGGQVQAVRKGDWKGLYFRSEPTLRLFDLRTDPREETNVADEHPDIVREMIAN
jgi:arylsulfatase A